MNETGVERTIWIAASRQRIWRAITDPAEIPQWWGGGDHWDIPVLQVGGSIKFGKPDDPIHATIAVLDPPRQFAIEWPPQPQNQMISARTTFTLDEENGGTRVTVIETGYESLPVEARRQRLERTARGYEMVLANLKTYSEATRP